MTLAACGSVCWPPQMITSVINSALAGGPITFDSSTDRLAYVGISSVTDTLTTIYWRAGTITSAPVLDVRVETVSNGRPSGTLWAANTNGSCTPSGANTWQTVTLTSAASLTPGDQFAIVFVYSSGTANFQFTVASTVLLVNPMAHIPVILQDTGGGTWGAPTTVAPLCMFVEFGTAGVRYLPNLCPIDLSITLTAFNSGSAADEYALKVVPPFKCRVIGIRAWLANIAAGANFTVSLWPSSSTTDSDALGQCAFDGDMAISTSQDGAVDSFFDPVTLTAGNTYYLGVRADTANNLSVPRIPTPSGITDSMKALPPQDASFTEYSRAWSAGSAGSWTQAANNYIPFSLLIDQLDDGAGGGGGAGPLSRVFTGM